MHWGETPEALSLTQVHFTAAAKGQRLVTSCALEKAIKQATAPLLQEVLLTPPVRTLPSGV